MGVGVAGLRVGVRKWCFLGMAVGTGVGIDVGVGVGVEEGSIIIVMVGDIAAAPRTSLVTVAWAVIILVESPIARTTHENAMLPKRNVLCLFLCKRSWTRSL